MPTKSELIPLPVWRFGALATMILCLLGSNHLFGLRGPEPAIMLTGSLIILCICDAAKALRLR